jgi:SAM-dependent methyltransferase
LDLRQVEGVVAKLRSWALRAANRVFQVVGLRLVRTTSEKSWDATFARWIAEAKRAGVDPNDVGDQDWGGPALDACTARLFPHLTRESVVLELGPGSGRYTRHVLPRCREMVLVDYSKLVCEWLSEYLKGKGRFRVHHIDRPALPMIDAASIDFVFANGVFEHIDPDETDFFLQEFFRVLKPGGTLWFNFDNFLSPGGLAWFRDRPPAVGERRLFRFYHPEFMKQMVEMRGFDDITITTGEGRLAFLDARKRQ